MIKVENVSFHYKNGNCILENLNLEIQEGEIVSIIGKNGTGKSTFLNLLAGMTKPSQGDIWMDEFNTKSKKNFLDIRKKVGIVFQNPDNQILFPRVYDDVEFALKNLGLENRESRIEKALELVNMKDFKGNDTYELSLGQKQRINIASILAIQPKYILLDEPTTMLDSSEKDNFYRVLKNLKQEGYTVIFVTNYVDEILLADKILVMEDKQIATIFQKGDILEKVDLLKKCGIQIPKLVQMLEFLKQNNINIQLKEWTQEELIQEIVRIWKSEKYC